jgi:CRP-like cAMP-binding protein
MRVMQMEQIILEYISKYVDLTPDEERSILKEVPFQTFPKGTHILKQGEVSKACYFNIRGLVREYETFEDEEVTTYFYTEGEAIVAFESASKKIPTEVNWICEEETTLVVGQFDRIDGAYARNPKLEKMSALFVSENFGKYKELSRSFIALTPEQRYLKLLEHRRELIQRVTQYHLASYLGIKPETLSRIRRRLAGRI